MKQTSCNLIQAQTFHIALLQESIFPLGITKHAFQRLQKNILLTFVFGPLKVNYGNVARLPSMAQAIYYILYGLYYAYSLPSLGILLGIYSPKQPNIILYTLKKNCFLYDIYWPLHSTYIKNPVAYSQISHNMDGIINDMSTLGVLRCITW